MTTFRPTQTIELIVAGLEGTTTTIRAVHDQVDGDLATADILHTFLEELEQYSWMVSAENRTPTTSSQDAAPDALKKTSKRRPRTPRPYGPQFQPVPKEIIEAYARPLSTE